MIEFALFRGYLALESFLEESFLLYLLGRKAPLGRAPRRIVLAANRRMAEQLVVPEGREFANWDPSSVANRAERFFQGGGLFTPSLRAHQAGLGDARTIRNAVAHEAANARQKFESLVRRELGTLPPSVSIGGFLDTAKAGVSPPLSFLEIYLDRFDLVADLIVPT